MKRILLLIISLTIQSLAAYAQDSYQKKLVLEARERERTKTTRLRRNDKPGTLSSDAIIYPNTLMTWGKGFSNRLAKVTVNGKAGFIDSKGQIVIKPKFKEAGQFSENLAPFENNYGKWGYIDTKGMMVIKPQFDWAISFREGFALVQCDDLWGFINKSGKFVIKPEFKAAKSFAEDLAAVAHTDEDGNYLWNFIDKQGNLAFANSFDDVHRGFNGGLAIVSRDLGYSKEFRGVISESYVIDKKGRDLWALKSWYVSWFSDDVLIVAVGKNTEGRDLFSAVDHDGKRIFEKSFTLLHEFREGLSVARVGLNDKCGVIDKNGIFVIQPVFEFATSFSEGLAGAEESYKSWGFIDKSGRWAIRPQYEWVDAFSDGFALVAMGEKTGYIDRSGNYVWKPTK
jgi:hypothetical protein